MKRSVFYITTRSFDSSPQAEAKTGWIETINDSTGEQFLITFHRVEDVWIASEATTGMSIAVGETREKAFARVRRIIDAVSSVYSDPKLKTYKNLIAQAYIGGQNGLLR